MDNLLCSSSRVSSWSEQNRRMEWACMWADNGGRNNPFLGGGHRAPSLGFRGAPGAPRLLFLVVVHLQEDQVHLLPWEFSSTAPERVPGQPAPQHTSVLLPTLWWEWSFWQVKCRFRRLWKQQAESRRQLQLWDSIWARTPRAHFQGGNPFPRRKPIQWLPTSFICLRGWSERLPEETPNLELLDVDFSKQTESWVLKAQWQKHSVLWPHCSVKALMLKKKLATKSMIFSLSYSPKQGPYFICEKRKYLKWGTKWSWYEILPECWPTDLKAKFNSEVVSTTLDRHGFFFGFQEDFDTISFSISLCVFCVLLVLR